MTVLIYIQHALFTLLFRIADTDEIEEVKEKDAEPVICDKGIERKEIPEVHTSRRSDTSNESVR